MITPKQLKAIDITYFTILASGSFTVTLQSRNTGHCWHILFQEYPHFKSCLLKAASSTIPTTKEALTIGTATALRFPDVSVR